MSPSTLFRSLTALLLLCAAAAAPACEDDPRVAQLRDLLARIDAGQKVPAVRVTASTYLAMNPRLTKRLAGHLDVYDGRCVPFQTVDGEPAVKVEAPFADLYNAFYDAVLTGNTERVDMLRRGFRAAPEDPLRIFGLIAMATPNHQVNTRLANALKLTLHKPFACDQKTKPAGLTLLDLYVAFGGRSSRPYLTALHSYNNESETESRLTLQPEGDGQAWVIQRYDQDGCRYINPNRVAGLLARAGMDAERIYWENYNTGNITALYANQAKLAESRKPKPKEEGVKPLFQ